MPKVTTGFHTS